MCHIKNCKWIIIVWKEWGVCGGIDDSVCAVLSCFSCVQLFAAPWTVACQAPLSVGFSRQEYWSGLPCPPSGDLPDTGIKPSSCEVQKCRQRLQSHLGSPETGLQLEFSNKVLSERIIPFPIICNHLHAPNAELCSCNRDSFTHKVLT